MHIKAFCYLYWKNGVVIVLFSSFQANAEVPFPSLGGKRLAQDLAHIAVNMGREDKTHIVTKLLSLEMISEKRQTLHQNTQSAPHGKILVLFSLGKESVEITSKNDRKTEGVSVCLPPPGGAIAATKSMSLTCTTPLSSYIKTKK